jgi:hypothetical protein
MIVIIVGPIDYWWNENWETPKHLAYMDWREHISKSLVEAGHLVIRPWMAMKGAWDERAQVVNDAGIDIADVMINVRPPGVPAFGTEKEVERFLLPKAVMRRCGVEGYFEAPPGDYTQIEHLIKPLDDPYSDVHRKSYTNGQN